jgi:hypothetical protein
MRPNRFFHDAEHLRKRLVWKDNGYWMIIYSSSLAVLGMISKSSISSATFFVLSAIAFLMGVFFFIRNKLFFRNHTLLELAHAWRGALWTFTDVPRLRKITQDGSVQTIERAINQHLLELAMQSLKWRAVGETNTKRSRNLLQKIESLVALAKKCKLGCYQRHEVWSKANFELDNPKQNP